MQCPANKSAAQNRIGIAMAQRAARQASAVAKNGSKELTGSG
jgi:hypothetical protein